MRNALIRPLVPESSTGFPALFNISAKRLRSDANHLTVLSRLPQQLAIKSRRRVPGRERQKGLKECQKYVRVILKLKPREAKGARIPADHAGLLISQLKLQRP